MDSNETTPTKDVALHFLDLAFGMKMQEAAALLCDDASWWVIGDPEKIKVAGLNDRKRTIRMMSGMHKVLPQGMRHRIEGVTAEGDRVAVEVEAEGLWHDGRSYRNSYHFLFRIKGGKVASIREYMDPMQILA